MPGAVASMQSQHSDGCVTWDGRPLCGAEQQLWPWVGCRPQVLPSSEELYELRAPSWQFVKIADSLSQHIAMDKVAASLSKLAHPIADPVPNPRGVGP